MKTYIRISEFKDTTLAQDSILECAGYQPDMFRSIKWAFIDDGYSGAIHRRGTTLGNNSLRILQKREKHILYSVILTSYNSCGQSLFGHRIEDWEEGFLKDYCQAINQDLSEIQSEIQSELM